MGNRILITGGGGYLGSRLAAKLVSEGKECFLLDRHFNELSKQLAEKNPAVNLLWTDITNLMEVRMACSTALPDQVYHLAALIDRTRDFSVFDELWEVNVLGTKHLLEALYEVPANRFSLERFCFAGSSEVYGTRNQPPFREEMVPEPVSPYSLTKLMAEELIRTWSLLKGMPSTIFRIFLFAGPSMPPSTFLGELQQSINGHKPFTMTEGLQQRDYLLLDDLLECMNQLAQHPGAIGETVNLCSGTAVSMKEIAEMAVLFTDGRLQVDQSIPYRSNEIWEIRGSNEKLRRLLPGFIAKDFSGNLKTILPTETGHESSARE